MNEQPKTILIGGSAGALEALEVILPALTSEFTIPVVVLIHIPPDRPTGLAALLQDRCGLRVREAEDKDELTAGILYCAPPNYHMLLETNQTISLSIDPPVHFSRPSIDVLFSSAAESLKAHAAGILLSGANGDGAAGLADIQEAGGVTIVQKPETADCDVMPRAGLNAAPKALRLTPEEIASFLSALPRTCQNSTLERPANETEDSYRR